MKLIALLACSSALTLPPLSAFAQAAPAPSATASDPTESPTQSGAVAPSQTDTVPTQVDAKMPSSTPAPSDDIIVTGSRVVTNGYQAPTPVTVVGSEELRNSSPSITEALRQLPQLTGSTSPATASNTPSGSVASTSDTANLRNLGITRTLVLLDGRRPPASGVTGTADISLFPQQLIKRVDIVTGGASAAYGSDAVAGVVNFILDTKFRGVLAEARNGVSTHGDGHAYGAQLSAGFGFAGDRGSIVLNGSISKQDPIDGRDRDWASRSFAVIPNIAFGQPGQPQSLLRQGVNLSIATFGGLITTTGPLRDIQFDAAGNPTPYRHGTLNNGTTEVGGEGAAYPGALISDYKNRSAFAHVAFEITPDTSVFVEGSYGYSKASYPNFLPFDLGANAYVIRNDNAYLPDSVRRTMLANNIASVQLGKVDLNFGQNIINNVTETFNVTAGFSSKLGPFTLDGYYEHGETRYDLIVGNQRINANAKLAADAVFNTAGQIVCRSTLTNPTNGCVPFSPFGTQPLTAAQRAYQQGTGFANSIAKQDVAALSLRGNLFSLWAGDVAAAIGAEYRDLSGIITVDPISQSVGFSATNPQPSGGSFNVKEAFGELLVPLFRGSTVLRSLDFNGAFRYTDYSTSGGVNTWKVGLTSEILPDLRLRGTYSQDIRAPNIGDLFGPRQRNVASIRDPFNGNRLFTNIFTFAGSNPNLLPERARTLTAGATYRPGWFPGFGASVDYYRIRIADAISTLAFQRIVDQCFAGETGLCQLITRDAGNQITQINGFGLNIQTVKISGVDFDASYQTRIGSDRLNLRAIASYLGDLSSVAPGAPPIQQAGKMSAPKFRGSFQATYTAGNTTVSVQERLIGSHRLVIPPVTVDQDDVPAVFYTSLTVRQQFDAGNAKPELFLTVNNLFDKDPPVSDTTSIALAIARTADATLYDQIGRTITIGGRVRF